MVRLKGKYIYQLMNSTKISIPYGAIKRGENDFSFIFNSISIPYGAIKSTIKQISQNLGNIFQFLMVRLKGIDTPPQGSLPVFQFLMVRLKEK